MVTLVPTGNGLGVLTQQPCRLRSETCEEVRVFSSSSMISAEATNGMRVARRRSTDMGDTFPGDRGRDEGNAGGLVRGKLLRAGCENVTARWSSGAVRIR